MNSTETRMVAANYVRITRTYFDDIVFPAFKHVAAGQSRITKHYTIAGKKLCLEFYSSVLAENMTHAFSHLSSGEDTRALTVHLFDSASSGVSLSPPWAHAEHLYRQEAGRSELSEDDVLGVYLHGEETLTVYDRANATAYFWTKDATLLPPWVSASPLRTLLSWFLAQSGISLVHGAVVAHGGKAVLLTAKGGSGKSTTALHCLASGMEYLADDYVGIESGDPPQAHSLYSSAKLVATLQRTFLPQAWNTEGEKAIMFLSDAFLKKMIQSAALHAIFIPMITHKPHTNIVPASKGQALLALAPTTLFQLPLMKAETLEILRAIVEQTPCYFLELGTDGTEIAEAVAKKLDTL